MEPGQGGEPRAEGAAAITPAEGKPRACRHRPGHGEARASGRFRQPEPRRADCPRRRTLPTGPPPPRAEARPAPPRRGGHADPAGGRDLGGQSAREHRLRPRGRAGTAGAGALRQRLRRRAARAAGRARDAEERARLQPERRPAPAARAGARRAGRAGQHAAAARRADQRRWTRSSSCASTNGSTRASRTPASWLRCTASACWRISIAWPSWWPGASSTSAAWTSWPRGSRCSHRCCTARRTTPPRPTPPPRGGAIRKTTPSPERRGARLEPVRAAQRGWVVLPGARLTAATRSAFRRGDSAAAWR